MGSNKQTMKFKTETKQLLDLMIHSLYSNKEVFLRELISNASDALDKLRFELITDSSLAPKGFEGEIRLTVDTDARTLTISDNGIGMTRDEVESDIGTIARSGTQELQRALKESKAKGSPAELIGQFGVGFYSCFMAADKVSVITKKAGEETATVWEYSGGGEYTLEEGTRDAQGTDVILHLKPADPDNDLEDFTSEWAIKKVVKKYSDFVRYPIVMPVSRQSEEDGEKKTTVKDETLNSMKAIWRRSDNDVTDEERAEFYKHISHDWTEPLAHVSMKAEGRLEYQVLLFIPSHAPFDLFSQSYKSGLQLYVKNVKIMDHLEDLLPVNLRFLKGVVDAQDLPLNVSREILQNNRHIATIRQALTKKVLDTFKTMKEKDLDKYNKLWKQFGAVIKEGVALDPSNKDRLLPVLMFQSSADSEKLTSLDEYVERMKDDQEAIYYLSGEARNVVEQSPHLEAFAQKGYEVLFFTDTVDEFMVDAIGEFKGKKLKSVGKGEIDLNQEEDKEKLKEQGKTFDDFTKALQKELDEHIKEVRLTNRLTNSPACLVGSEGDVSPHIERLMRANKMDLPVQKRVLEINPDHEVITSLKAKFDVNPSSDVLADYAKLLHGQALLAESSPLPDPVKFAELVAKLMAR